MTKHTLEALKEFARMALLSILPIIITSLEADQLDIKTVGITLIVAILRSMDKWVHENPSIPMDGISPI